MPTIVRLIVGGAISLVSDCEIKLCLFKKGIKG
jgi:hypothetical protein